jgi:excisionase family DNA binding protein
MNTETTNPNALVMGVEETARTLSVSPCTVRTMVKSGELKSLRIGNRIRIPVAEVHDFIRRNVELTPVSAAVKGHATA